MDNLLITGITGITTEINKIIYKLKKNFLKYQNVTKRTILQGIKIEKINFNYIIS